MKKMDKKGIKNRKKEIGILLTVRRKSCRSLACVFLAALLLVSAGGGFVFPGRCIIPAGMTVYAQEESELMTEPYAPDDSGYSTVIADDPTMAAIVAVSQMGEDATSGVLTEEALNEIDSMSMEEMARYFEMAVKLMENPEVRSLFEYQEVRDLAVLLVHNALDLASEDPALTQKVMKTMGVDQTAIAVLLYLLKQRGENKELIERLTKYVTSDEANRVLDMLIQEYHEYQEQGAIGLGLLETEESASTESEYADTGSEYADTDSTESMDNMDRTESTEPMESPERLESSNSK